MRKRDGAVYSAQPLCRAWQKEGQRRRNRLSLSLSFYLSRFIRSYVMLGTCAPCYRLVGLSRCHQRRLLQIANANPIVPPPLYNQAKTREKRDTLSRRTTRSMPILRMMDWSCVAPSPNTYHLDVVILQSELFLTKFALDSTCCSRQLSKILTDERMPTLCDDIRHWQVF